MNSENSKTSNPHRLILNLKDKTNVNMCIIKKHETVADNPPIRKHKNKIENRITFKTKS